VRESVNKATEAMFKDVRKPTDESLTDETA
jgi:hypothetical protein